MSWMVFLIAAVPAGVVAWVGCNKTSRALLYTTFALAVLLGVVTGNPAFMGADIVFALIGLYIGYIEQTRLIKRRKQEAAQQPAVPPPPEPVPAAPAAPLDWSGVWVWWFAVVLFFGYKFMFSAEGGRGREASSPQSYSPPHTYTPAPQYTAPPAAPVPSNTASTNNGRAQPNKPVPAKPRTVEQCLQLRSEEAMVRCMEHAP